MTRISTRPLEAFYGSKPCAGFPGCAPDRTGEPIMPGTLNRSHPPAASRNWLTSCRRHSPAIAILLRHRRTIRSPLLHHHLVALDDPAERFAGAGQSTTSTFHGWSDSEKSSASAALTASGRGWSVRMARFRPE
jgi:hypothetical protein